MLITQDEDKRALQRVDANQAVEARRRAGWARQGLIPGAIDTIMMPVRGVHAEDDDAVRAYKHRTRSDTV